MSLRTTTGTAVSTSFNRASSRHAVVPTAAAVVAEPEVAAVVKVLFSVIIVTKILSTGTVLIIMATVVSSRRSRWVNNP